MDRFVLFADVPTGKSFIDGKNGFFHALVVCCGEGTTFAGSNFLFCIVVGIEFLAIGFDCFVLTFIVCLMVAGVVMEIDCCCMKRAVSPLSVRSMWPMRLLVVWQLVSCCPVFVWFVVTLVWYLLFFLGFLSLWADATCSFYI